MSRPLPSTTLAAAVRAHFGLTQAELARYLLVSPALVCHAEAGRRRLPPLVHLRLTRLARLLPPPEGFGPPAFVPVIEAGGAPRLTPGALLAGAPPLPEPLTAGPLRRRQRQCARQLVVLRRDWHELSQQVARHAHRRWAVAGLAAALVPHPADVTAADPAEQAHLRKWLAELAATVPLIPALRPDAPTALALLLLRLAAVEAEIAALTQLLAAGG